ncbi:MAG: endonuclease/exonuclease/phosphatase family protein [Oligoflexus sp.]|nr:endonuclease/exonuclease/phosphatase family protein [Oligoflexus sp.]
MPSLVSASDSSSSSSSSQRRTDLRIGSFNIQVFGESKVNKSFVKDTILSIISRYDIIFIQEIRDDKNKAIYELLDLLNQGSGKNYKALVSTRLGRGDMKEQYAYFYDAAVVTAKDSYVFKDTKDEFSREPFVARFKGQGREFTLAGIHIAPTNVRGELRALPKVKVDITAQYGDDNTFFLGDFNADCIYYKAIEGFDFFDEIPRLLISDAEDTTVAASSCTYDRVLGFGPIQEFASEAHAFNFAQEYDYDLEHAKLISDHYPIEFTIQGTGSLAEIRPIPNKPQPIAVDPLEGSPIEQKPVQKKPIEIETPVLEKPASAEASCGLEAYTTPAGRCYGSFDSKKLRVSAECCL